MPIRSAQVGGDSIDRIFEVRRAGRSLGDDSLRSARGVVPDASDQAPKPAGGLGLRNAIGVLGLSRLVVIFVGKGPHRDHDQRKWGGREEYASVPFGLPPFRFAHCPSPACRRRATSSLSRPPAGSLPARNASGCGYDAASLRLVAREANGPGRPVRVPSRERGGAHGAEPDIRGKRSGPPVVMPRSGEPRPEPRRRGLDASAPPGRSDRNRHDRERRGPLVRLGGPLRRDGGMASDRIADSLRYFVAFVGREIATLSAGRASRYPWMDASARKVTLPRAASAFVNV